MNFSSGRKSRAVKTYLILLNNKNQRLEIKGRKIQTEMKPEGKGKRRSSHCSLVEVTGVLWAGKGGIEGGERHLANNSVLPWDISTRAGNVSSRLLPHL